MEEHSQKPMRKRSALVILFLAVLVIILLGVFTVRMATTHLRNPSSDLDLSTTQKSANQFYQLSYVSEPSPAPINQMHTWRLHVQTPDGAPVENAIITVHGDMPQHGHGMPTQPQVTQNLDNGDYLVEGMKFQMGGWWVVDFTIQADGQSDTVRFNLLLTP